jgi:hypothetical protein
MSEVFFLGILILLIFIVISIADPPSQSTESRVPGDGDSDPDDEIPSEPTQGWILVSEGDITDIEAALLDYDEIRFSDQPAVFRAELHPQEDGTTAVLFTDGLPAYDMANMTGWLNAPVDQSVVHGTMAWLTSPSNGDRYYLEPDPANSGGDTLYGADQQGQGIRVHLPDTGAFLNETSPGFRDEPVIKPCPTSKVVPLTLDRNTAFGNPLFQIYQHRALDRHHDRPNRWTFETRRSRSSSVLRPSSPLLLSK